MFPWFYASSAISSMKFALSVLIRFLTILFTSEHSPCALAFSALVRLLLTAGVFWLLGFLCSSAAVVDCWGFLVAWLSLL
jgi:hypothetical protein